MDALDALRVSRLFGVGCLRKRVPLPANAMRLKRARIVR